MKIGSKIRDLRITNNLSQDELAKKVGYSNRCVISAIESNTRDIPRKKLTSFAKALNVSVSSLCDEFLDTIKMPVVGDVYAGYNGIPVMDFYEDYEFIPSSWITGNINDYMLLRVRGDSMADIILEGDLILVKKQSTCETGQLAVCFYDNEYASLKEIRFGKDYIDIIPYNKDYQPKRVSEIKILGVAVRQIRLY